MEPSYLKNLDHEARMVIANVLESYNSGVRVKIPFLWVARYLFSSPVRKVKKWCLKNGQTYSYINGPIYEPGEALERIWKYGRTLYHHTKFDNMIIRPTYFSQSMTPLIPLMEHNKGSIGPFYY